MAITQVDKIKILKYFRETSFGEIYYNELVESLGKRAKVTDIEFITFFVNYISESFNKNQPSFNLICKMLSSLTSFIGWVYDDKIVLGKELINQLYSIRDRYERYLIDENAKRNSDLDGLMTTFEEKLNGCYPKIEEEVKYDVNVLLSEIDELRKKLNATEQEVSELNDKLSKQNRAWESKRKDNTRLIDKLENSKLKQKRLEDKIKELENIIEQLNGLVASLKQEVASSRDSYDILLSLKTRIQSDYFNLKNDIKVLRKRLEESEKEVRRLRDEDEFKIVIPKSFEYVEDRNNRIEALIIQKMLSGKNTLEDVRVFLADNGYVLSIEELRKHFELIRGKMEYEVPEEINLVPEKDVKEGSEYVISLDGNPKCIDLMLVSDFHLSAFGKEIIADMELINDYCEDKGISLILNAGDFFSWTRLEGKHKGTACQRIVDKAIAKYPSRKGIKHAVLGGNHDKDMLAVGIDPIRLLADAREDFINLGYGHCKITFGGSVSILDSIGIHHPNRRYQNPVDDDSYTTEQIRESIYSYYAKEKISSDDVYVNLLGHIHKSGLDMQNGICIVPSYRKDRVLNGAWHLKVYFNNGYISNIVFIPVIKTKKLVPTSEINYEKKLVFK